MLSNTETILSAYRFRVGQVVLSMLCIINPRLL
jgi:hypothetical protein